MLSCGVRGGIGNGTIGLVPSPNETLQMQQFQVLSLKLQRDEEGGRRLSAKAGSLPFPPPSPENFD